ncbi:MAG: flagellar motor protein [Oleiphilaceae bacterium]|uniref:flagellar motor protein n=1 Tax=Oleiphilus sp. HI0125 TaxID=1822266 RepID=UPI0007C226E8|nr:flagellar motor protein [Oleiphilus sp. HI0125]KZZ56543.1 flagellar motor protein [Oleiphilus sp. HI0125]KZZ59067.1 flagellar motor protein [Oleiphilus sp. HI0125]MCH2159251.1 flagellar motor protein [Oleiphilaceae bacterium]
MDYLSVVGLLLAFVAIFGGNAIEGGTFDSLINGPAALIVIGGTLAAVLVQTPTHTLKRSASALKWVFFPPHVSIDDGINKLLSWSVRARKDGLLGLESVLPKERESFCKKGLQLLVDGAEPESIQSVLEVDMLAREQRDLDLAKVYDSMAGYSPTIGIIGAVLGLIHVMSNLADPSQLGAGIATAFVATIYGVGLANLVFLPIANKIRHKVEHQTRYYEMVIDGLVSIAEGENPRSLELKLKGYLHLEHAKV